MDNRPAPPKPMPKGDLLDEMIGQYIFQANCPVPIKKLGNGYYIFGTRKIYAKILNGKLVIRVGGGFMIIEEFINTYAEQELNKINNIQKNKNLLSRGGLDDDDVDSLDIPPASRHGASSKRRSVRDKTHLSPRTFGQAAATNGLPHSGSQSSIMTGAVESSISGT